MGDANACDSLLRTCVTRRSAIVSYDTIVVESRGTMRERAR